MERVRFHWSPTVIVMTVLIFLFFIGVGIWVIPKTTNLWLRLMAEGIIVVCVVWCLLLTPLYLSVENGNIRIKKVVGNVLIPIDQVEKIERLERADISDAIRTFASGGFCGYLGHFYSRRIGYFTMYATEMKGLVSITTPKKRYVVSCRKYERLIGLVHTHQSTESSW